MQFGYRLAVIRSCLLITLIACTALLTVVPTASSAVRREQRAASANPTGLMVVSPSKVEQDVQPGEATSVQVEIFNPRGIRVARVDFLWHEYGVIGECDGFGKYFDSASPAESRHRLGMEKDRDAELMALGYRVLHWRWRDLEEPHLLAARIRRVLFAAAA